jgi:hypothetical protein
MFSIKRKVYKQTGKTFSAKINKIKQNEISLEIWVKEKEVFKKGSKFLFLSNSEIPHF